MFQFTISPTTYRMAEQAVGNVKSIVSKLAMDHPKQWHMYLPMVMWCLPKVSNKTTGVTLGL